MQIRSAIIPLLPLLAVTCAPGPDNPVDARYDTPVISGLLLPLTSVDTDTLLVGEDRLPDDQLTIRLPASVDAVRRTPGFTLSVSVLGADGERITATHSFNDDGIPPDTVASDGRYSGIVSFTIERSRVGSYAMQVNAVDDQRFLSNTLSAPFVLVRSNLPPVVSGLEADTLVSASSPQSTLQIRIRAVDPNGQSDVRRVWFDSYRQDGSPSSGNPFLLLDDGDVNGISGDVQAGDAVYGLKVALQGASVGTYTFRFMASDRSRDTSNVITHIIAVVP